jgi:hypothetical protein
MIEYDDRDRIHALLLPSSHSGRNSSSSARRRSPDRTRSCRTRCRQRQTAAACANQQPAHIWEHGVAACAQARGRHHMSPISPLMEAHA